MGWLLAGCLRICSNMQQPRERILGIEGVPLRALNQLIELCDFIFPELNVVRLDDMICVVPVTEDSHVMHVTVLTHGVQNFLKSSLLV